MNIVTANIEKFSNLQKFLYNEFGIILSISNNKKTSLLKANFIINLDFSEELLNKYVIYDKALIINISGKILIKKKKFDGINVNYFKAFIPNKYEMKNFKDEIIYESIIYKLNFEQIINKINRDKIKIKNLIGNNGEIQKRELK